MYTTKADDLARIANDLSQLARKYSDGAQHLDQQTAGLDGATQQLIAGGPEHWLGVSSEAFQGAWDERRVRLQQVSQILSQSAQHFTQFAQTIENNLPTIRADQALRQESANHMLGTDDQVSILDDESQAQNAIINALSLLNSQLEQMAEEVKDCPQEREQADPLRSQIVNRNDSGEAGGSKKTSEQRIKDSVSDQGAAQTIIELAQEKGKNLDEVATLLEMGIDTQAVTQLLNTKRVDLQEIATSTQTLLDAGIRVNRINSWIKGDTKLRDAVAILKYGVDLNLIGTSNQVGDFTHTKELSANDIISRLPDNVQIEHWNSTERLKDGMNFAWRDANGDKWTVRIHGPNAEPKQSWSTTRQWSFRVQRGERYYMDSNGTFYNEKSPTYTKVDARATHMPIQYP